MQSDTTFNRCCFNTIFDNKNITVYFYSTIVLHNMGNNKSFNKSTRTHGYKAMHKACREKQILLSPVFPVGKIISYPPPKQNKTKQNKTKEQKKRREQSRTEQKRKKKEKKS